MKTVAGVVDTIMDKTEKPKAVVVSHVCPVHSASPRKTKMKQSGSETEQNVNTATYVHVPL